MGRKPFVLPEVLEHESLSGLTLQSPPPNGTTGCFLNNDPTQTDRDCDGVADLFDAFPDDDTRF